MEFLILRKHFLFRYLKQFKLEKVLRITNNFHRSLSKYAEKKESDSSLLSKTHTVTFHISFLFLEMFVFLLLLCNSCMVVPGATLKNLDVLQSSGTVDERGSERRKKQFQNKIQKNSKNSQNGVFTSVITYFGIFLRFRKFVFDCESNCDFVWKTTTETMARATTSPKEVIYFFLKKK